MEVHALIVATFRLYQAPQYSVLATAATRAVPLCPPITRLERPSFLNPCLLTRPMFIRTVRKANTRARAPSPPADHPFCSGGRTRAHWSRSQRTTRRARGAISSRSQAGTHTSLTRRTCRIRTHSSARRTKRTRRVGGGLTRTRTTVRRGSPSALVTPVTPDARTASRVGAPGDRYLSRHHTTRETWTHRMGSLAAHAHRVDRHIRTRALGGIRSPTAGSRTPTSLLAEVAHRRAEAHAGAGRVREARGAKAASSSRARRLLRWEGIPQRTTTTHTASSIVRQASTGGSTTSGRASSSTTMAPRSPG